MWSRTDFETLKRNVPFPVVVDWDARPSALKYGHVNSLLAVIRALHDQEGTFFDASGKSLTTLEVAPLKRRLTDQRKRTFSIVGHDTASPMLIARVGQLEVEIYLNQHLFVQTETTYRQYFPSASVILRTRNFLIWGLVPSPGSWGSDIISMTYDWLGTLILEVAESGLTGQVRRNFRGYKFVPARDKLFLSRRRPPLTERRLLNNNGFANVIIGDNVEGCWPVLSSEVSRYIREQTGRLGKEGTA
jgi:hypothetical protein